MGRRRRELAALLLAAATSGACGSLAGIPAARPQVATRLNEEFRSRIFQDSELKNVVMGTSEVTQQQQRYSTVVMIHGGAWSEKTRSQQDRVLQKIGFHMREALHEVQPAPPRNVFSANLHNDLRQMFGFVVVGGLDDDISYRAYR